MAHIDNEAMTDLAAARHLARTSSHVYRAKLMLVASGIAAFGIVAVAATVMTTIL